MSPTTRPLPTFLQKSIGRPPVINSKSAIHHRSFQSSKLSDPLLTRYHHHQRPSPPLYHAFQISQPYNSLRQISTTAKSQAAPLPPPSTPAETNTTLSIEEYNKISDASIETLLAQLEEMQEEREDVDVEYSVCPRLFSVPSPPLNPFPLSPLPPSLPRCIIHITQCLPQPLIINITTGRRPNPRLPSQRHICAEQATTEQTDLAQ